MMSIRLVIECDSLSILFPAGVSVGDRGLRRVLLTAAPPSPAERLEQRRGVRIARRLRLNETDLCLLVLPLRVEKREIARRAELELLHRHVEAFARGGLGIRLRLERDRVELQGKQDIGDVLERAENGLLILRERLVVGGLCAAFSRLELPCVKNRLEQAGADVPDLRAWIAEQLGAPGRSPAEASTQGQLRKHERLRDADARVRLMQDGFRRADVRALAHEVR